MIKTITRNTHDRMMFWALLAGIAVCGALYSISVQQTVLNVVKRAAIEKNIATLRATTTTLESRFLALSSGITSELALSLGYKETTPTLIQRQSLSMVDSNPRVIR